MSIGNVYEFHQKFGFPTGEEDELTALTADDTRAIQNQNFRVKFLREELEELVEALNGGDRVAAFDALLDLVYVAHGTALFLGISPAQWAAGMHAVHSANMAKVKVASALESKRGHGWDAKKPHGWVGPEARLKEILSWWT